MYSSLVFHFFLFACTLRPLSLSLYLARHCCGSRHKTFNFTPFAIEQTSVAAQDIPNTITHDTSEVFWISFPRQCCQFVCTIFAAIQFQYQIEIEWLEMHSSIVQVHPCKMFIESHWLAVCANASSVHQIRRCSTVNAVSEERVPNQFPIWPFGYVCALLVDNVPSPFVEWKCIKNAENAHEHRIKVDNWFEYTACACWWHSKPCRKRNDCINHEAKCIILLFSNVSILFLIQRFDDLFAALVFYFGSLSVSLSQSVKRTAEPQRNNTFASRISVTRLNGTFKPELCNSYLHFFTFFGRRTLETFKRRVHFEWLESSWRE